MATTPDNLSNEDIERIKKYTDYVSSWDSASYKFLKNLTYCFKYQFLILIINFIGFFMIFYFLGKKLDFKYFKLKIEY